MKRLFFLPLFLSVALSALCGCSEKAIMISRGNVNERGGVQGAAMMGSPKNSSLKRELCNGDIDIILGHTSMDPFQRQEFKEKLCGINTSEEDTAQFFNSLPLEQRREFERSCERYGYYLNDYG